MQKELVYLPLAESFYGIQGEGCHSGKPAYFIRLGGCDVCCDFCDSKSTWNVKKFPLVSIDEIVDGVIKSGANVAIVTGGEPLIHNLDGLCTMLKQNEIACFLETSGSRPLSGEWDWICVSPKLNSPPLLENLARTNELKVVIKYLSDFEWAEENAAQTNECLLFLQPEWSVNDAITPQIIDYVKQNPQWNLSVQLHKYLGIP